MHIEHKTHVPGAGSYVVVSRFGPSVAVEVYGPATYSECERYIETHAIVGIPAQTDDRGVEYVENGSLETLPPGWATCGHCDRAWNDAKPTSVTPTPSARCPFEDEHDYDDDDE